MIFRSTAALALGLACVVFAYTLVTHAGIPAARSTYGPVTSAGVQTTGMVMPMPPERSSTIRDADRISFEGATIGESAQTLLKRFGEPELSVDSPHGVFWAYSVHHDRGWLVCLVHGARIEAISISAKRGRRLEFSDAFGVRLGDVAPRVDVLRGAPLSALHRASGDSMEERVLLYRAGQSARWLYGIDSGFVERIGVTISTPHFADYVHDYQRDGSDAQKAVPVRGSSAQEIDARERVFLAAQTCQGRGAWRIASHERIRFRSRLIDHIQVSCTQPTLVRPYYFMLAGQPQSRMNNDNRASSTVEDGHAL